jgi:hypothetical protein
MTRAFLCLALGIAAGLAVMSDVRATPLDPDACAKLKVEREGLEQAGVRGNMAKGPQWAKANLASDKLEQIRRLIDLEGQLLFRCSGQRLVELPASVEADPAAATPPDDGAEDKDATPKADAAPDAGKKAPAKAPAGKASPAKAKTEDKAKQEDAAKTKAPQKKAPAKRAAEKTGADGGEPLPKAAAAKHKAKAKAEDAYKAPPPADPNADPFAKPPQ